MLGALGLIALVLLIVGVACWADTGETKGKAGDSVNTHQGGGGFNA